MFGLCEPAFTNNTVLFLFPTGIFPPKHDPHEVAQAFCAQVMHAPAVAWHGSFVELDIPE